MEANFLLFFLLVCNTKLHSLIKIWVILRGKMILYSWALAVLYVIYSRICRKTLVLYRF